MSAPNRTAAWTRYRTAILLSGFVVLGWISDFALGGGLEHSLAWALALILVGGISALAAHSAADTAAADEAAEQPATAPAALNLPPSQLIRPAEPADFELLIEIEQAADKLFEVAGYGTTPGPATAEELAGAELLLVAGEPPVGYARLEVVDGRAHLEGLSVRPRSMRQGIGSALVRAVADWATAAGYPELSLTTFAEVPWNGPFYAGLGFVELTELSPGLRAIRAAEQEIGLDRMGRRLAMVRQLTPEAVLPAE